MGAPIGNKNAAGKRSGTSRGARTFLRSARYKVNHGKTASTFRRERKIIAAGKKKLYDKLFSKYSVGLHKGR